MFGHGLAYWLLGFPLGLVEAGVVFAVFAALPFVLVLFLARNWDRGF
jgi:hypothetical protein